MKHGKKFNKLSRTSSHRRAMLRNMASSLFQYGYIETTLPKAKALRPFAEKIITKAIKVKKAETYSERLTIIRGICEDISHKSVYKSLVMIWAVLCLERPGGYLRILKLGRRKGDGAEMALIGIVIDKGFGNKYAKSVTTDLGVFRVLSQNLLKDPLPTLELTKLWTRSVMPKIQIEASFTNRRKEFGFTLIINNLTDDDLKFWPVIRGEFVTLPLVIEIECSAQTELNFQLTTSENILNIPSFVSSNIWKVRAAPFDRNNERQMIIGKIENHQFNFEAVPAAKLKRSRRGKKNEPTQLQIPELQFENCEIHVHSPIGRIFSCDLLSLI